MPLFSLMFCFLSQVKHEDTLIKDGGVKMISEIFLTRLLSTKVSFLPHFFLDSVSDIFLDLVSVGLILIFLWLIFFFFFFFVIAVF